MKNKLDGAVKSAQRALAILELLTQQERPLTFVEIADALGYPRSSVHGLLKTMIDRSWLELNSVTRRYGLGLRNWEAGNAYLRAVQLPERARPYMERVRDALDETVQLAVLDGRYNVYIGKVDGSQRLVLASEIGRRLEAHATGLGKVLLAGLPGEELEARLNGVLLERFTANTITERDALVRELKEIQERGYALDREEYTIGVRCLAVPVHDHSGRVTASMSVSVPTVRFDLARQEQALTALREAAWSLSAALGFRDQQPEPSHP
jgi:DNA-binding IclR family transcriptional regulator